MSADKSSPLADLAIRFGAMGDRPDDHEDEKLKHRLLVWMGLMMTGGGLMWGSIALYFGLRLPAIVPLGYVSITAINLAYFRSSKNFVFSRAVQVLISLLLPFLFQWSLGGFAASGAVMLWAMLALVGSLTFSDARSAAKWLTTFIVLTIVSGLIDETVRLHFSPDPSEGVRTFFFVANIVVISSSVFGLTIYLMFEREHARRALAGVTERITVLNEKLEDEVAERTGELQAALARSRAVLDNMVDGLVAIDREGEIKTTNPALAEILFIHDVLEGRLAADVLPGELSALAQRSNDSNAVEHGELTLPGKRIGAAVASPIFAGESGEERVGSVVIVRDVTYEREIDQMKTDFIATVSHELRTPLTSVLGFAKLSKKKLEADVFPHVPEENAKGQRSIEDVANNLDIVVSEAERLTALIGDVLDISNMEAGRVDWQSKPVDPKVLVERAYADTVRLFRGRPLELAMEVTEGLPTIEGDFERLLQVLVNLVSNAAKFSEEGLVTIGAQLQGESLELFVEDTGTGVDEADQSMIFKKFKQVGDTLTDRPTGTGLGLPISKQIVEAHGGTIEIASQFGKGARLSVLLPLR